MPQASPPRYRLQSYQLALFGYVRALFRHLPWLVVVMET